MSATQSQDIKCTNQSSEQDSSEKQAHEISYLDSKIQFTKTHEQDLQDHKYNIKK